MTGAAARRGSDRWSMLGAYGMGGLSLGLLIVFLVLGAAGGEAVTAALEVADWREEVPFVVEMSLGGVIGALLAARRPRDPAGWLMGLLGIAFIAFDAVAAVVAVTVPADDLWVRLIAWIGNWVWALGHAGAMFLLFLMPTGRPLSPRWGLLARIGGALVALVIITTAVIPGPLEAAPRLTNPLGVELVGAIGVVPIGGLIGLMTLFVPLAAASLVVRFVRSRGVERQQLKWIAYGVVVLVVTGFGEQVGIVPRVLAPIGSGAVTVALVIAVTRYRLYDIDRLVSRTLSYALITAVLVGIYSVAVVTLRGLLAPLTGDTDLAVAGSTLAVAAVFGRVRRRVQRAVDRRFNRRSYDAATAVDAFGQRLRDEVDIDEVAAELRVTVARTVQPAAVSVVVVRGGVSV